MGHYPLRSFPRQKLSSTQKSFAWAKKNVDAAVDIFTYGESLLRTSIENKTSNHNLRKNIINYKELENVVDPHKIGADTFPKTIKHIGIGNNKLNLLVGEDLQRKDDFKLFISANDVDGVSKKERELSKYMLESTTQLIQDTSLTKDEFEQRLEALDRYKTYDFQDIQEMTANKLAKIEYKRNNMKEKFSQTFDNSLTTAECVMFCGMVGSYPVTRVVQDTSFYTLGSGSSNKMEDAEIKVEFQYLPLAQVIDSYHELLPEEAVNKLETDWGVKGATNNTHINTSDIYSYGSNSGLYSGTLGVFSDAEMSSNRGFVNSRGEIRVAVVNWKSRKLIYKVKYRDEFGQPQYKWTDEHYMIQEENGEELVKKIWINDEWEGTLIGEDIYVQMRPIPVEGRSRFNISKTNGNYVGQIFNHGRGQAQSLLDIIKPLDLSYDIVYWKRDMEIATYTGDIDVINKAMIPSNMDTKAWMKYVTLRKKMLLDPTQEILKGPSKGKSAGAFNTLTATKIQGSGLREIGMYSDMLLSIDETIGKVSGISPQREADVHQSETVGGVERALQKSSHITERYFAAHNSFKQRLLNRQLDVAKYAYRKYPRYAQYAFDDMGMAMLSNFEDIASVDFDLHLSNSAEDFKLYSMLEQNAQALIQNNQILVEDFVSITKSESTNEIAKKLERSTKKILEQRQAEEQQAHKNALALEDKQAATRLQEIDRKGEWSVKEALIRANAASNAEVDNDLEDLDRQTKEREQTLRESELRETARSNRAKEDIERKKATSTVSA